MKIHQITSAAILLIVAAHGRPLLAQDSPETIRKLERKIEELDQKIKILERNRDLDLEAAADKAKGAAIISAGANGIGFRSADTNFVLRVRGYVQTDARFYPGNNVPGTGADTFMLRRVRPIIEGTVYEKYDYRLMLDLGQNTVAGSTKFNSTVLQDAYVTAKLFPEFQIQVGKFKPPVGLERLQSGRNMLFAERGFPTALVPNRDLGVQLQGDLFQETLRYEVGAFNGTADGASVEFDNNGEKDVAARLFATPFKNSNRDGLRGVGFGVAGTVGHQQGAPAAFKSPGQQNFLSFRSNADVTKAGGVDPTKPNAVVDGDKWRFAPQAYYYFGPFGIFGEYVISSQRLSQNSGGAGAGKTVNTKNTAWQVAGSWFVTGEENSFAAVVPRKPFSFGGEGWGAVELAARIGQLDVDDANFPIFADPTKSATQATSWGIGVNWHLNRSLKLTLDYDHTDFVGGSPSPLLTGGENFVVSRVQFSF